MVHSRASWVQQSSSGLAASPQRKSGRREHSSRSCSSSIPPLPHLVNCYLCALITLLRCHHLHRAFWDPLPRLGKRFFLSLLTPGFLHTTTFLCPHQGSPLMAGTMSHLHGTNTQHMVGTQCVENEFIHPSLTS